MTHSQAILKLEDERQGSGMPILHALL